MFILEYWLDTEVLFTTAMGLPKITMITESWLDMVFQTRLKTALKALVIPILEYACPVWNPYFGEAHQGNRSNSEKSVPTSICGPDKEYPERLLELKWDSLELRRKYLSLVQMYKIIFGYCDINCHQYFDIIGITRTRSKHEYKIRPKLS